LIALLALVALADEPIHGPGTEGHRIEAVDAGTGLGVGGKVVVGPDGGTHVLTVTARVRAGDFALGGSLPFASYRVPDGRDGNLGNARLWAHYRLPWGSLEQYVGLRVHFQVGKPSWTWANAADEVWPGAGVEAYWESRLGGDALKWLLRGAVGFHVARAYEPFPEEYVRFQVAGGLDARIVGPLGVVGEMSVQYWDTSPWEVAGLLRVDPFPALRIRAGAVLPIAVWAGLAPAEQPAGVRESTLLVDLTFSP